MPSTIVSSYSLTLPNTAKMANLYNIYSVRISLESSINNQFRILVDVSDLPDGNYRLKFTVKTKF